MQAELSTLSDSKEIVDLHINSPGGSITEGLMLMTLLQGVSNPIHAHITFAASMATVIALSADEVSMNSAGLFMIHQPLFPEGGNASEMREKADLADHLGEQLEQIYMTKTGLESEVIRAMMDAETLMTAEEAFTMGFVDSITKPLEAVASMNLTKYNAMNFETLKAQIKNIGAAISGTDEDSEEVQSIVEETEAEAEKETSEDILDAEGSDVLTAEMVSAVDFKAFEKKVNMFIEAFSQFIEAQQSPEEQEDALEAKAQGAVLKTLASIKAKAQVPVKSGSPVVGSVEPFIKPSPNQIKANFDAKLAEHRKNVN